MSIGNAEYKIPIGRIHNASKKGFRAHKTRKGAWKKGTCMKVKTMRVGNRDIEFLVGFYPSGRQK